jgi:hypothetical protein
LHFLIPLGRRARNSPRHFGVSGADAPQIKQRLFQLPFLFLRATFALGQDSSTTWPKVRLNSALADWMVRNAAQSLA